MSKCLYVFDCDPDRELLTFSNANTAHFPEAECAAQTRHGPDAGRRTTAACLFDDTPICLDCRGVAYRDAEGGNQPLPMRTEVAGE